MNKIKKTFNKLNNFSWNKKSRLKVILFIFCCLFFIIIFKLCMIDLLGSDKDFSNSFSKNDYEDLTLRHDIVDRNGNALAVTIPSTSIYLRPKDIVNKNLAVKAISESFHIPVVDARSMVNSRYPFVWVKRNVSNKELQNFLKFGVIGIYLDKSYRRFYPYGNYFSNIVGMTNIDGKGISGVENYFDKKLSQHDIQLSLDLRLQIILRDALEKALINNKAKHAFGLIVNPNNGEVLALVSLPDFNPNDRDSINPSTMFNNVTQGVFEQGSTFKLFTLAMALDSNSFFVDDYFDVSKPIVINNYVLVDDKYIDRNITMPEVLMYSSDVASSLMARSMGADIQKKYFTSLGLFNATSLEIPEKSVSVVPKNWNTLTQMTLSYGYGMAVSQATEANAIEALINGGCYIPLTILKKESNEAVFYKKVINYRTSELIKRMARLVVAQGTGKIADIKGYNIAGKTGSAEKITIGGSYDRNKSFSSFVAFFPAEDPQYLIFVSVDEPKRLKYNLWNITGSMVSGPAIAEIITKMGNLLALPKNEDSADGINPNNEKEILDFVNGNIK